MLGLASLFFQFLATEAAAQCPPATQSGIHVVQKKETMYSVSRKYGVPVADLLAWNNRKLDDVLSECTQLWVKNPGAAAARPNPPQPAKTDRPEEQVIGNQPTKPAETARPQPDISQYVRQTGGGHIVAAGETVEGLAKLYGYTPERFREFNSLADYYIAKPGDFLRSTDCTCPQNINGRIVEVATPPPSVADKTMPSATPTQPIKNTGVEPSEQPKTQPSKTNTQPAPRTEMPTSVPASRTVAPYMTNEERLMVDEINLIRTDPQGYVKYVEEYIRSMQQGGEFGNSIATARELIGELRRMAPLSALQPSECIYRAAKKHGLDQKPTGETNHQGTDGSMPWDRVLRECPTFTDGNENIVGGPADIRRAVMLLLVDDGIESRGHRRTLLDPNWRYVACYKIGQVGTMPNSWVQNFGY